MSELIIKLQAIKERYDEVGKRIIDPDVIADMKQYIKLSKEYKELEPIVQVYYDYKNVLDNINSSKEIISNETDADFIEMAKDELDELVVKKERLEEEIKILLVPKDPEDEKNAVVEIRAGTGGDEASIFAGDIFRIFTIYCESRKWNIEIVDVS